jgi:hypothetical protein
MACLDHLQVVSHPGRGRLGFRVWPEDTAARPRDIPRRSRQAEREARMPVYRLVVDPESPLDDPATTFAAWRVRDRAFSAPAQLTT